MKKYAVLVCLVLTAAAVQSQTPPNQQPQQPPPGSLQPSPPPGSGNQLGTPPGSGNQLGTPPGAGSQNQSTIGADAQFGTNQGAFRARGITPIQPRGPIGITNSFGATNSFGRTNSFGSTNSLGANPDFGTNVVAAGGTINEPSGTPAQDRAFTQRLRAAIVAGGTQSIFSPENNSNITIANQNGVVTLSGNVKNEGQRRSLEARIKQMQGVTSVNNQLVVSEKSGDTSAQQNNQQRPNTR
jgi:hypothetical protein